MRFWVLALCVAFVSGGPVKPEETVITSVVENLVNCNSDFSLCFKEQALKVTDRLGAARKLKIIDGITIYNNDPKESRSLESLSEDPAVRNKQVTEKLWEKASNLFQSSELELSYGAGNDEEDSRALGEEVTEESRGKKKKELKKKLKILIPLILLAKAKAIALAVLSLVVIAVSIFKIAVIAKIAFIVKLIAIIKALLAKKNHEEVSYEPAGHGWEPHAEHHPVEHGHGWEGGWSRSRNEANNLAYSAYAN